MNSKCPTCKKMLYRTDDCKGGGVACGRTDGGRKPSGGSSVVERQPSKLGVAGSTPARRSNGSGGRKLSVSTPPAERIDLGDSAPSGGQAPDLTTRGTPRKRAPKGTFDRKAYQAQKARERRARLKGKKP